MSIRLRDTNIVANSGQPMYASSSVELCACDGSGSEAKAFLPVKLLGSVGGNPAVATIAELKVSSDTQSNSRGVRRVMVKVELPYQSLPDADVRANGGVVDSRRSGQAISAHIVVSVPRTAAEDLTGSRGTDAQKAALAQIRGILSLLLAFTSPEMAGSVRVDAKSAAGGEENPIVRVIPNDGEILDLSESGKIYIYSSLRASGGRVKIDPNALNGQTGLSFTELADSPIDAYDPLWRGLLGQKPMTCQQEVSLPATDVVQTLT